MDIAKKKKKDPMKLNASGIDLIKSFESCKLTAYKDIVGVMTIGWGHTGSDVTEGLTITQQQADDFFLSDMSEFEDELLAVLKVDLSDNQYSALLSFLYNLGITRLKRSTLLEKVNAQIFTEAADAFLPWDMAGGQVSAGLKRRREAERTLFLR